jgi:hypothetical protein
VIVVCGEIGLSIQVVPSWEQSEPIKVPSEAYFSGRKMAFSMHMGARIRTGDSAASALVRSE